MRVLLLVTLAVAVLAGGCSLVQNLKSEADRAAEAKARSELVARDLELAQRRLPFVLRLPQRLPTGTRLMNVAFDTQLNDERASIDVSYELASGDTIHIWQSDAELPLERNPVRGAGDIVTTKDGQRWVEVKLDDHRVQYASRWPGEVTVTVDFNPRAIDPDELLTSFAAVASSRLSLCLPSTTCMDATPPPALVIRSATPLSRPGPMNGPA